MATNRTRYSLINLTVSAAAQFITLFMVFIVRTFLVHYMGENYVGIEGVLNSVMQLLSLTELGFGSVILYRLYAPFSTNDHRSAAKYLRIYRIACFVFGLVILASGFVISFFIPSLMKGITINKSEIYAIYWMFIINTALPYWIYTYCGLIFQAAQKNYINILASMLGNLGGSIGQIFFYVFFHNYIGGLIVLLVCQSIYPILLSIYAKRKYGSIMSHIRNRTHLDKKEKVLLIKDVYAFSLAKLCKVGNRSVPAIIISVFISAIQAGLYSNYAIIQNAVDSILTRSFNSITASVGNLGVSASNDVKQDVFDKLNFFIFYILGIVVSLIWCITNEFVVTIWGETYLLSQSVVLAMCANIVVSGFLLVIANFKEGMGIFWKGRYRPLIGFILTVIFSILFIKQWGIAGVIWVAAISRILTELWFDPLLVYKYALHSSPIKYFIRLVVYIGLIAVAMFVSGFVCSLINLKEWLGIFVNALIAIVVPIIIFSVIFFKTDEYKFYLNLMAGITGKILKRSR